MKYKVERIYQAMHWLGELEDMIAEYCKGGWSVKSIFAFRNEIVIIFEREQP